MPVVQTSHLFAPLHRELVGLLRSLREDQWHAPTVAGTWRVRDVVAHLLQGDLSRLSRQRDGYSPAANTTAPASYDDVLRRINDANHAAVNAMQHYSPRVLTDLIDRSGGEMALYVTRVDPRSPALYPVAWAGETESLMWLDIGREYTERWHHQQQIRDAVGAPLLLDTHWTQPLFALSVRALPRAFEKVQRDEGTAVFVRIEDVGEWSLVRYAGEWRLREGAAPLPACTLTLSPDAAWRIFYNAVTPDEALCSIRVEGDEELARTFTKTRSVMV